MNIQELIELRNKLQRFIIQYNCNRYFNNKYYYRKSKIQKIDQLLNYII